MHLKDFDIKKEGNLFHITKVTYPRMSLKVDFSRAMVEVKDILMFDECTATEIKEILSNLEDLIGDLKI